jgi:hypothetical protein
MSTAPLFFDQTFGRKTDSMGQNLVYCFFQLTRVGKYNYNLSLPSEVFFVKIKAKNNQYNAKIDYQNDASKKSY